MCTSVGDYGCLGCHRWCEYEHAGSVGWPGVERVFCWDDVGAVATHQPLHAVVKRSDVRLGSRALLDDLKRVSWAAAQRAVLTGALDAAVGVHAVCESVWGMRGRRRTWRKQQWKEDTDKTLILKGLVHCLVSCQEGNIVEQQFSSVKSCRLFWS